MSLRMFSANPENLISVMMWISRFCERPRKILVHANLDYLIFTLLINITSLAAAHGPITQSTFLRGMGIGPRMQMLLKNADAKNRKDIAASYDRLVSPLGMGTVYKVMAVTPEGGETPYPFQPDPLMETKEAPKDKR